MLITMLLFSLQVLQDALRHVTGTQLEETPSLMPASWQELETQENPRDGGQKGLPRTLWLLTAVCAAMRRKHSTQRPQRASKSKSRTWFGVSPRISLKIEDGEGQFQPRLPQLPFHWGRRCGETHTGWLRCHGSIHASRLAKISHPRAGSGDAERSGWKSGAAVGTSPAVAYFVPCRALPGSDLGHWRC